VFQLRTFLRQMQVRPSVRVHSVDLEGIELAADVAVDNPSAVGIQVNHPTVTVQLNGADLGASRQVNKTYDIRPRSPLNMDAIRIRIPWSSLAISLTQVPSMVRNFLASRKLGVKLEVQVFTTARIPFVLGNFSLPISQSLPQEL
jgi:hypothetical protein